MTIEGRPDLIPDPSFEAYMMKSYNDQRRDRLGDVISDYLNDDDKTAKEFYDDLISEIDDWIQYHQRFAEKYKEAKKMINGHRKSTVLELDTITDYPQYTVKPLNEDAWAGSGIDAAWDNFPNETGDHITL